MQSIWEHRCVYLTVATRNWILPNSCIPLPNLIFRYCERQMAEVRIRSVSAHAGEDASIFTCYIRPVPFNDLQVHLNIDSLFVFQQDVMLEIYYLLPIISVCLKRVQSHLFLESSAIENNNHNNNGNFLMTWLQLVMPSRKKTGRKR